jgi:hypothetical protein
MELKIGDKINLKNLKICLTEKLKQLNTAR